MGRKKRTILVASTFARFDLIRFFMGTVKTIVYAIKPSYLKAKITNVISGTTINQLANDFRELQNRITLVLLMMEDIWKF